MRSLVYGLVASECLVALLLILAFVVFLVDKLATARARIRARQLDPDLDLTLTQIRARAFELANDVGLALTHTPARDLDPDLARTLTRAHSRARALARDLDPDLASALARARDLDLAKGLSHALTADHDRVRDLARDLSHAATGDLARLAAHARDLGRDLSHALDLARINRGIGRGQPARLGARMVVRAAAGLLPRGSRARYTEEYLNELADLTTAGAGRWQQLRYSARLLTATLSLRVTLAWAHRRREAA